ncbi:DUF1318 domain-containing protein [Desulfonema ishimotonii]|uniref:DUF1318 domain-containing protein n=1 Tax=Desulfonema ishimotonii TaxID=45657 RepID=A0A401G2C3_9BACT|nr:DUF1318 domain-containing protein [Desulfonema ishimotonii]GBC63392.1 DUF1318 domain-containing protein [Desulfonema ishimotonii]
MRYKRIVIGMSIFLIGLMLGTAPVRAGDIKARMKARLPQINALKSGGVVGENNGGFLEFRSGKRESADVVNAENNDRKQVYAAIAGKQGTTPDLVGKRRALQIRERARPGEWLQDESGKWYKK